MLAQTGDKNGRADVAQRDKPAGEPDHDANSRIRLLALGLVVGSTYYFGALIGFARTLPNSAVSTLWPSISILLAALLLTRSQRTSGRPAWIYDLAVDRDKNSLFDDRLQMRRPLLNRYSG